jgi:hypothetical protein
MFWRTIWEDRFKEESSLTIQYASYFFKLIPMSLDCGAPS